MAQLDEQEVSDEVAADALRSGRKSRKVPTHSAMETEFDPEANATDAAEDDDEYGDEDDKGY
jgi:hypothetical protein